MSTATIIIEEIDGDFTLKVSADLPKQNAAFLLATQIVEDFVQGFEVTSSELTTFNEAGEVLENKEYPL